MLHDGGEGYRHYSDDGREHEVPVGSVEDSEYGGLALERQSEPGGVFELLETDHTEAHRNDIGTDHAKEYRHNAEYSPTPDVGDDNDKYGQYGYGPRLRAVGDGATRQRQTDGDHDGSCNDWWEETKYLPAAEKFNESCKDEIDHSRAEDADTGIVEREFLSHSDLHAHALDRLVSANEGEGGAEESRHLKFGDEVEDECSDTCEEQSGRDGQSCDDRDEDSCAKHGEKVL